MIIDHNSDYLYNSDYQAMKTGEGRVEVGELWRVRPPLH